MNSIAKKLVLASERDFDEDTIKVLECYILILQRLFTKSDYLNNKIISNYLGMQKPKRKDPGCYIIPMDKPTSKYISDAILASLIAYQDRFYFGIKFNTLVDRMLNKGYTIKIARAYCTISFFLSKFSQGQLDTYLTYLGRNKGYRGKYQLEFAVERDMQDYMEQKEDKEFIIPKYEDYLGKVQPYLKLTSNMAHEYIRKASSAECAKYLHVTPGIPKTKVEFVTYPAEMFGRTKRLTDFLMKFDNKYDGNKEDFDRYYIRFLHSVMKSSKNSLFFIYRTIQDTIADNGSYDPVNLFEDISKILNNEIDYGNLRELCREITIHMARGIVMITKDPDIRLLKRLFPLSSEKRKYNKKYCSYMSTAVNWVLQKHIVEELELLLDDDCLEYISMYILDQYFLHNSSDNMIKDIIYRLGYELDRIRKMKGDTVVSIISKALEKRDPGYKEGKENEIYKLFDKNLIGNIVRLQNDDLMLRNEYFNVYKHYVDGMIPTFFPFQELKSEFGPFGDNIDEKKLTYITALYTGLDTVSKIKMNLYVLISYIREEPVFYGINIYTGRPEDEKGDKKGELLYSEHLREGEIQCPGSEVLTSDSEIYTRKIFLTKRKNVFLHQFIKEIRYEAILHAAPNLEIP